MTIGQYLQDQMAARGWGLSDLAVRSGVARADLAPLLEEGRLEDWPSSEVVARLVQTLQVPARDVVLKLAEACGLPMAAGPEHEAGILAATNEELMLEMRRRLVQGATIGGYLGNNPTRERVLHLASRSTAG